MLTDTCHLCGDGSELLGVFVAYMLLHLVVQHSAAAVLQMHLVQQLVLAAQCYI